MRAPSGAHGGDEARKERLESTRGKYGNCKGEGEEGKSPSMKTGIYHAPPSTPQLLSLFSRRVCVREKG